MEFNPNVAHIRHSDGTVFQVLNEDGTDWDEMKTSASYSEFLSSIPAHEPVFAAPEEKKAGIYEKAKSILLTRLW